MVDPTPLAEIRQWAAHYIGSGAHPIEIVGPLVPKSQYVKSPGKQPAHGGWTKELAPMPVAHYRDGSNLGLRMGLQPSGRFLIALDVDCPEVTELLKIADNSEWPDTLVAKTGRLDGGYHFLFTWPTTVPFPDNGVKLRGPDGNKTQIDIRSEGGQIVVAPSTHPDTGGRYEWVTEHPIAELPESIARTILARQRKGSFNSARVNSRASANAYSPSPIANVGDPLAVASAIDSGTVGGPELSPVSDGRFRTICRRLSNRDIPVAVAFENLLRGTALAEPGGRDDVLTRMAWHLARELPNADPDSIAKHFEQSLSLMHTLAPFAAPCDMALKFRTAVAKQASEVPEIQLLCSATGTPTACTHNILQVLRGDKDIQGRLTYDAFSNRVMIARALPWDIRAGRGADCYFPREYVDDDGTHLTAHLMAVHRLNLKTNNVYEALQAVAREHSYHPVQEYMLGLKWDGVPRIDTWLIDYVSAEDKPFVRKVGAWWLMSAFMRIADPGCQADYCLILEGLTGRGKSQAFKALVGPAWFSDSLAPGLGKESAIDTAGKWVIELAELSAIRSIKDVNQVKAFITRCADRYRVPYGKVAQDFKRQCVFAGTTNDSEYLQDTTGNRRFWPVTVGDKDVDIEALKAVRDQLWAEAAYRAATGERYWPKDEVERTAFEPKSISAE